MSPIGRLSSRLWTTCFVFALLLALPSVVGAEDYTVSSPLELQNALNEAAINGEDDTITIAPGTYAGSFHFDPHEAHSLLLRGAVAGDPAQVVLEGKASPARAALGTRELR